MSPYHKSNNLTIENEISHHRNVPRFEQNLSSKFHVKMMIFNHSNNQPKAVTLSLSPYTPKATTKPFLFILLFLFHFLFILLLNPIATKWPTTQHHSKSLNTILISFFFLFQFISLSFPNSIFISFLFHFFKQHTK